MSEAKTSDNANPNYTKIEKMLAEEMPVIPIYHYAGVFMLNPTLKGWPFATTRVRASANRKGCPYGSSQYRHHRPR